MIDAVDQKPGNVDALRTRTPLGDQVRRTDLRQRGAYTVVCVC